MSKFIYLYLSIPGSGPPHRRGGRGFPGGRGRSRAPAPGGPL